MAAQQNSKSVGFIGAGRMATALATGLVQADFATADNIFASDAYPAALDAFAKTTKAQPVATNREVLEHAEIIILAVKPQQMGEVLADIASHVADTHLVVSIAAGVPLSTLLNSLGADARVVRVMPNTPCLVGEGASAFALGGASGDADASTVNEMLSTVGTAVQVKEQLLDAVTGLSGSGPAYVYQFIEALSDGGVRVGLPRDIATQLAAQTVLGAAKMVLETGEHPGQLKDAVTSPGGTTIAGLQALEEGSLRGVVMKAVTVATERSQQLGES